MASRICYIQRILLESESIDLELSKTVLGMFLRALVTILCLIEVLEIGPKKEGGPVKKKTSQFWILIDFNKNLMKFQIKQLDLNNEFFHNHASKKYEIIFLK